MCIVVHGPESFYLLWEAENMVLDLGWGHQTQRTFKEPDMLNKRKNRAEGLSIAGQYNFCTDGNVLILHLQLQ
jgi:hypothetical protein